MIDFAKLPSRKLILQSLKRCTDLGYKRDVAVALIAKRRGRDVAVIEQVINTDPQVGRPRQATTKRKRQPDKIGVCTECGETKVLSRRELQSICCACVSARKPDPDYEYTFEEMDALKAAARELRGKRHPEADPEPVEVMMVYKLGVLNGRAGSFSAYD